MTPEEIISRYHDQPVGRSIDPVAESLATRSVYVATDDTSHTQPELVVLERLRFKTAADNEGRLWAYAYTSEADFSRAFPDGGGFAELIFRDFFAMVEREARFAGIVLNSSSVRSIRYHANCLRM